MLIDTDILIDAGRAVNDAITFLQRTEQTDRCLISTITQMELIVGARNKNELRLLEKFLKRFTIVKVNETISDIAVDLVRHYRLSHGLLIPDALIAATAIALNEPLATKNRRDNHFITGVTLSAYP